MVYVVAYVPGGQKDVDPGIKEGIKKKLLMGLVGKWAVNDHLKHLEG